MRRIKRAKKGFSLLEVIISVGILGILLVPIASVTIATINRNKESESKQRADFIGQKVLEEIRSLDEMQLTEESPGVYTFQLLNGQKLRAIESVTEPGIFESVKVYSDVNPTQDYYEVNDEKGGTYNVNIDLVRDDDASYEEDSSDTIVFGNYKQKLCFYSDENSIDHVYTDVAATPRLGTQLNLADVTPNLVLNIDTNMNISLTNGLGVERAFRNADAVTNPLINKILIKLDEDFKKTITGITAAGSKTITILVRSDYPQPITIEVYNENKPEGKINIETDTIADDISIIQNQSTYKATTLGNLYKVEVNVSKLNTGLLFEGVTTKNILITK